MCASALQLSRKILHFADLQKPNYASFPAKVSKKRKSLPKVCCCFRITIEKMPSTTTLLALTALAAATFLIMQSYTIAQTGRQINRMMLGSMIPTVVFGHILAFYGGRGAGVGRAKLYNILAIIAVVSFFIMEPYTIAHTAEKSHRIMMGCLLPPVLFGHIFAYLAGRASTQ